MANLQLTRNLHQYREAHNYTQEKVSKYLNITRQAYSNYETGKRDPDVDLLIKLAELYGVTLNQLITDSYSASFIREHRPPYITATEPESNATLFLTKDEAELIMKYRTASDEDRYLVTKILNSNSSKTLC